MNSSRFALIGILLALWLFQNLKAKAAPHEVTPPNTYCNPMNLDYAFVPWKISQRLADHRSTADPACVRHNNLFYLFSTNQEGYWWSRDLSRWNYVWHLFKENATGDQVCAPAALSTKRGLLFLPCRTDIPHDSMPLYISKDPRGGKWTEEVQAFPVQAWDPGMFQDDDGKIYLYWGSSNVYPIYGTELDPKDGYRSKGGIKEILKLDPAKHGWERFGEDNINGKMDPFIEGAWVNKIGNKYYLQYGAPGTEWNIYADGVYISNHPLGPFTYQTHNPFCWKPTGFVNGAGHGSTFDDRYGNLWHIATTVINVKYTCERRLGLFPAGVDEDGVLFADTAFGDYPHYIPKIKKDPHSHFTNWFLLSYKKHVWASSERAERTAVSNASDENIKTYWSATDGSPGQFLAMDLGKESDVRAIQVNYADEDAKTYGKQHKARHRYKLFHSHNGKDWLLLIDRSQNNREVPHDYIELSHSIRTRYLKLVNVEMPTGCFAISDLRVFGSSPGTRPGNVENFRVQRHSDERDADLTWDPVHSAYAYEIRFGSDPKKLYHSFLVYGKANYTLHALNLGTPYYFSIRAVSESGLSDMSSILAIGSKPLDNASHLVGLDSTRKPN
ncbi:MAG: family 43 glycosylhydrolase [Candidatus Obscuribacterales bacterium]|nr:family 43 glycosylhydrolase [Candidatus Obscuribacterales bacterium]